MHESKRVLKIRAGEKTSLAWFRNYLVIVSREAASTAAPTSALAEYVGSGASKIVETAPSETTPGTVLTIYDLKNKFVAFTGTFSGNTFRGQQITAVLGEWGELFVLTEDRKVDAQI